MRIKVERIEVLNNSTSDLEYELNALQASHIVKVEVEKVGDIHTDYLVICEYD